MTPTSLFRSIAATCAAALLAGASSASTTTPPDVLLAFVEDLALSQIEITLSGSLDLTDFAAPVDVAVAPGSALVPIGPLVILSPGPVPYDEYEILAGAVPVFGVPIANSCSPSSDGVFSISGGSVGTDPLFDPDVPGRLGLPDGYTSGTALAGSVTCPGFAPGTSPFAYYGITVSEITVDLPGSQTLLMTFQTAPATVPLPAAGWMLLAGLGAAGLASRRRKTRQ